MVSGEFLVRCLVRLRRRNRATYEKEIRERGENNVSQTLRAGKPLRTPINKEREVKKFVYLHFGFVKPTPEIMQAWGAWFESISDRGGLFSNVQEKRKSGTRPLPIKMESITGYTVTEAESLDARRNLPKRI